MIFLKKNTDSFLEDLDDQTVEEISNMVNGMDDKMKDRIVEKCKLKMAQTDGKPQNIKVFRHHKWYRSGIAAVAAGLVIIAGIGFFSLDGISRMSKLNSDNANGAEKESIRKDEMSAADSDAAMDETYDADSEYSQAAEIGQNAFERGDDISCDDNNSMSQADDATTQDNTVKTDTDHIASELIQDFYKVYTVVGFGRVEFDSEDYIVLQGSDYHYCKVTDQEYTSIADIESLIKSCYTENAIEQKKLITKLHGEYSWFIEQNGSLYVKDHPCSWPVNLTDTPAQIKIISDDEFTAIKEYDNFGVTERIVFDIVNTDDGWKIDSYSGDYENVE